MRENIATFAKNGMQGVILLAVFSVPLIWLPFTTEFFEFNKQYLLYVFASLLLLLWVAKIIAEGKVVVARSPIDLFVFVFAAAYVVSLILSVDFRTSFWGFYPRLHGGAAGIGAFLVFYFAVTAHLREREALARVLWASLAAGLLVAVFGLLQFWKIFLPLPWETLGVPDPRFFATAGSQDAASIFVAMQIPLLLGFLIGEKETGKRLLLCALGIVFFFYVGSIALIPLVILVFLVLFLFPAFFALSSLRGALPYLLCIAVSGVILASVTSPLLKERIPFIKNFPSRHELKLDQETAWVIASSGFANPRTFLFGSGPATFGYDFSLLKPFVFNSRDIWNLRFVKSSNELFHFISTIGVVGALAFLAMTLAAFQKIFRIVGRSGDVKGALGFGAAMSAFLLFLSLFFTTSITTTMFSFWVMLGLAFALLRLEKGGATIGHEVHVSLAALPLAGDLKVLRSRDFLPILLCIIVVAALASFLFFAGRAYLAELHYTAGLKALGEGDGDAALGALRRARTFSPREEQYLITLSATSLNAARSYMRSRQGTEMSDQDKQVILALLEESRVAADLAAGFHPRSVRSWENRGDIYQNLAFFTERQGTEDVAIDSYLQARRLDPFNPMLAEAIGMTYFTIKNDAGKAIENLTAAITLKYDYFSPHRNIARVLASEGKREEALVEYDLALEFLPKGEVARNIAEVRDQITRERDQLKKVAPSE